MKAKKGYKKEKGMFSTGKWYKRYFEKRTCKRFCKKLIKDQKEMPPHFTKSVDDNFWELF